MRPLALPIAVSLLFIGWSPVIGQLRDMVKAGLGASFVPVVGLTLATTVLVTVAWAVWRVRDHQIARYGAMASALAIFIGYAMAMRTGQPDVDAVERIHFVEYGLLAVLFYRAWVARGLGTAVALTLTSGTLVGIGEEWLQWLVPTRVGDVRDVALNFIALGCGVIFATGLYPAANRSLTLAASDRARLARLAAAVVLAFGGFFHCAHLGYEHVDPDIGRFRSFFTIQRLHELAAERAVRWQTDPPVGLEPFAIQDHYLIEAGNHVLFRNSYYAAGLYREAWLENAMLERYYDPVLDTRSFSSGELHRWAAAQRDEVERGARVGGDEPWVSTVGTDRVYLWPSKPVFWTVILVVAGVLMGCGRWAEARRYVPTSLG